MTIAVETEALITPGQLTHLLQHTFGSGVELVDQRIGGQHHDYLVLLVQLRHPSLEVVVKLAGPEAPLACPFERTAMLHRLVAERTDIPMAETLAIDTSCRTWPWRIFIKAHIPGVEWAVARQQMDQEGLAKAYRQIGEAVGQLHAIHFPAFGDIGPDGSVPGDQSYPAALTEHAGAIIRSARLRDLFFLALEKRRNLFRDAQPASLCHEDLHKYNLLFKQRAGKWRLATILDFEKAWAGHAETDLARLELWEGGLGDAFWQAYKAICPVDSRYEQRRPVYQFLWCLEYAENTARHLADTQCLCSELELPRLESFG